MQSEPEVILQNREYQSFNLENLTGRHISCVYRSSYPMRTKTKAVERGNQNDFVISNPHSS